MKKLFAKVKYPIGQLFLLSNMPRMSQLWRNGVALKTCPMSTKASFLLHGSKQIHSVSKPRGDKEQKCVDGEIAIVLVLEKTGAGSVDGDLVKDE